MSSSLNQNLKGETSIRSQLAQNDVPLLSASGILQNNNTFCFEPQNEVNQNGYRETPTTPYQFQTSRNNFQIQNSNYFSIPLTSKDCAQQLFSPTGEFQGQSIFSPALCNNRDEQLILSNSFQFLSNPNFQFHDYDPTDIQATPYPLNGGSYSRQNNNYSHYSKLNSFQNSQRNTPHQSISPLGIMNSGGRIPHHAQISTPNNITSFNLQSAHNNLFSQPLHHQSPYNNNRDYQQTDYGLCHQNIENDPFEFMSLQACWGDPKNKEQDEDDQKFEESKLKKKQKIEEKVEMEETNEQDNDNNSYTHEEKENALQNGSKSTAKKINDNSSQRKQQNGQQIQSNNKYNRELTSSQKTMKQNFQISPQNDRYLSNAITPNKNIPGNFDYMTPAIISRQHILEEDHFEEQQRRLSQSHRQQIRQNNGNDGDSDDEKGGKRNQRGLRVLSMKVKDIVCELKETTYKSVAEYLLKDLEAKKQNNDAFAKDEQNIKRRVYDALNVLIAAQVLTKNGKKVKADHNLPKGKSTSQHSQQKKEYLETALKLKRDRLERKQETINDLMIKITALKSLCERNAQTEIKSNGLKQTISKGNSSQQLKCISLQNGTSTNENEGSLKKLKFPFIGVYSPSNNSRISFKKFSTGLSVSSIQQLSLKGDIDILVQLYQYTYSQKYINNQQNRYMKPELLQFMKKLQNTLSPSNEMDKQESSQQQLQKEIIIRNNKHIEQHHFNNSNNNSNGNTQKIIKKQIQQQQFENNYSQDEDSSQETINQPNQFSVKQQEYQSPLPQEYNQNNNSNEYEDSNQLVNDYMNMN